MMIIPCDTASGLSSDDQMTLMGPLIRSIQLLVQVIVAFQEQDLP